MRSQFNLKFCVYFSLAEKAEEKKEEMKQVVAERIKTEDSSKSTASNKEAVKPPKEEAPILTSKPTSEKKAEVKKPKELAPLKPLSSAEAAASWLSSAKTEAVGNSTGNTASQAVSPRVCQTF